MDCGSNGRSCTTHDVCGCDVKVNDKLLCEWGIQVIKQGSKHRIEEVINVHRIGINGLKSCQIGFLPVVLLAQHSPTRFNGLVLRIKNDLRISLNSHERARSKYFSGVLNCEIVRDNPKYNGQCILLGDACNVSTYNYINTSSLLLSPML